MMCKCQYVLANDELSCLGQRVGEMSTNWKVSGEATGTAGLKHLPSEEKMGGQA